MQGLAGRMAQEGGGGAISVGASEKPGGVQILEAKDFGFPDMGPGVVTKMSVWR